MPDMSMTEAAKWAGVTRATIHKAIQSGRLSAKKNDHGVYQINPAELERAYSPKTVDVSVDGGKNGNDIDQLTAARDREITLLREMVSRADSAVAELRAERDAWKAQAEAHIRLLTHPKSEPPQIVETKHAPAKLVRRGLLVPPVFENDGALFRFAFERNIGLPVMNLPFSKTGGTSASRH